jgi:hypothetical protein
MKSRTIIILLLLITLFGCILSPSNNVPISSIVPTPTSLPRWIIYERVLAKAIVNTYDGLCEWEIWGKSGSEIYVWALCKVREPIGTAGSMPAVIYLSENGEIDEVVLPRDGENYPKDIREMFPLDIQDKIFAFEFDGPEAENHINERLLSNGLPLIVISGSLIP